MTLLKSFNMSDDVFISYSISLSLFTAFFTNTPWLFFLAPARKLPVVDVVVAGVEVSSNSSNGVSREYHLFRMGSC
jgi:hypothetical protein